MKKVKILDTTLRDGSYSRNFSFTINETEKICMGLESAGVKLIEIGHGAGLNASNMGLGKSKHSDEEYMKATNSVLTKSQYGMFCIAGIAKLEDISLAYRHDMDFIRIGTDVDKIPDSKKYIKKAKECGMFVTANYMKSYSIPPEKFAENVLLSEKYGADAIYIVDSAGGMFGDDIKKYVEEIRKVSSIVIGFHGHNNLGLAVSNSITAAELGADLVDSSLQGLGRSSGNASTEELVAAFTKKGFSMGIDLHKILEIGSRYVKPLITKKGKSSLDIVAGFCDFHSSYMHYIEKYSKKYNVNPLSLMIEITKVDKVNLNERTLEAIANKMEKTDFSTEEEFDFTPYIGGEQDDADK